MGVVRRAWVWYRGCLEGGEFPKKWFERFYVAKHLVAGVSRACRGVHESGACQCGL